MEIEFVNFGAGELGFAADTGTLCCTVFSVRVFSYGGPECLALLLWEYLFSASWVGYGGFENGWLV